MRDLLLALAVGLRRRRVPVVHHLRSEHAVQHKARDEAVQDQLVVHLLEGREDAREGAGEIVEDLPDADALALGCVFMALFAMSGMGSCVVRGTCFQEKKKKKNTLLLEPLAGGETHEVPPTMGK